MNGLLITLVVLQSLSLLVQLAHHSVDNQMLQLAVAVRRAGARIDNGSR